MNTDILGRRPYSYWFISKLFVYDKRNKYYKQGIFYNFRCDSLNNKQAKFYDVRHCCQDFEYFFENAVFKNVYTKKTKTFKVQWKFC